MAFFLALFKVRFHDVSCSLYFYSKAFQGELFRMLLDPVFFGIFMTWWSKYPSFDSSGSWFIYSWFVFLTCFFLSRHWPWIESIQRLVARNFPPQSNKEPAERYRGINFSSYKRSNADLYILAVTSLWEHHVDLMLIETSQLNKFSWMYKLFVHPWHWLVSTLFWTQWHVYFFWSANKHYT